MPSLAGGMKRKPFKRSGSIRQKFTSRHIWGHRLIGACMYRALKIYRRYYFMLPNDVNKKSKFKNH